MKVSPINLQLNMDNWSVHLLFPRHQKTHHHCHCSNSVSESISISLSVSLVLYPGEISALLSHWHSWTNVPETNVSDVWIFNSEPSGPVLLSWVLPDTGKGALANCGGVLSISVNYSAALLITLSGWGEKKTKPDRGGPVVSPLFSSVSPLLSDLRAPAASPAGLRLSPSG